MAAHFIRGSIYFLDPLIQQTTAAVPPTTVVSGIVNPADSSLSRAEYQSTVSATRLGSKIYVTIGTVSLEGTKANVPVANGVIHYVSGIGNFVYKSAWELISESNSNMNKFGELAKRTGILLLLRYGYWYHIWAMTL